MKKILIIDDDPDICLLLSKFLAQNKYATETTFSGKSGIELLTKNNFDLILCDFRLPDMDGVEILQKVKAIKPAIPVIIITGYSDVRMAVKCLKQGAYEYVTKPIYPEEILININNALNSKPSPKAAEQEVESVSKKATKSKTNNGYIVGKSAASIRTTKQIDLVAPTDMSVIIFGETGTGKEFAARRIHDKSKRKNEKFVAVDCGTLQKEIAGSELFGHVKGSFTGAVNDKKGFFEQANGGTLFLDEIGNLSYDNQIKLLRVLQERTLRRIGSDKEVSIDVRIIVATNENMEEIYKDGNFREDLYYRLSEFTIKMPPLREREGDILLFAESFMHNAAAELNKEVTSISRDASDKLKGYYWQGNLRELKNVMKRAVLLAPEDEVIEDCLPNEIINPVYFNNSGDDELEEIIDLKTVAENAERKAIITILKKTGYNKSKTADILKVDRKTLYNKIKSYGIALS